MRRLVASITLLAGLLASGCAPTGDGPTDEAPPELAAPSEAPSILESSAEGLPPHLDRAPRHLDFVDDASKRPDRPFVPDPVEPDDRAVVPAYPMRLAISDTGIVYFTDAKAEAVFGFDGTAQVFSLTSLALTKPLGVEVLGDILFVGDGEMGTVHRYDMGAEQFVGTLGQGDGEFAMPNDLAITPDGSRIYVADSLDNAIRYYDTATGDRLGQFGARGSSNGQFHFPAALTVDDSRVYVADQGNHRISVFDLDGSFLFSFGSQLTGATLSTDEMAGKFTRVQGITKLGDDIAVLDVMYGHIQLFDDTGTPKGFIANQGSCPTCTQLALDVEAHPDGTLYVTDPDRTQWIRFSPNTRRAP